MKKIALFLALFIYQIVGFAQENMEKEPFKKIEVTGFAEMEILPDQIYFMISLKEFFKDEKLQKEKVTIDILEKELISAVVKAGIKKEDLVVSNISGYKNYSGKKKPQTFLESKQYKLLVSNVQKIDVILSEVNERGIEYVNLDHTDHSKIKDFKKEIKIKALQAAKEKAEYLLESINEKVGEVVGIKELDEQYYSPQPMYANMRMMASDASGSVQESSLEFQKIKLSYKMLAVFRIK